MVTLTHWPPTLAEQARLKLAGRIKHVMSEQEFVAAQQREAERQAARAVRTAEMLLVEARGR
jgi:hypothetical protein